MIMKKNLIIVLGLSLAMLSACKKDKIVQVSANTQAAVLVNPATDTTFAITAADTAQIFNIKWKAANYGASAVKSYFVQVDSVGKNFSKLVNFANTTGLDTTLSLSYGTLNTDLINGLNLTPNAPASLELRIGSAIYGKDTVYSKVVKLTLTTYKPKVVVPPSFSENWPVLYVPGAYQGNSPSTAGTVAAEVSGIYEGYINVASAGANTFAFASAPDLTHTIYGAGSSAGTIVAGGAANSLSVPAAGYYELVANTNTSTWTATQVTWSIIGDATPGGWNTDTQMSYNAAKNVWTVTAAMVSTGSYKFRVNDAWNIDFGIDANGHLQYADNPVYPYNGTLNNLTVATSGTYVITLDLSNPNYYTYTAVKQ
jgi:hypothetical protein